MSLANDTDGRSSMYLSFLLRLWRESEHGAWRASLENVLTGERRGFPNLASLLAFLEAECQRMATQRWEDADENL